MNNEKMAQLITQLRKEKQLTQKELAYRLGVTDKAVSKWERGLSYPDISLLSKLSDVLGITISELVTGEKAQSPMPEADAIARATLQYAEKSTNRSSWKNFAIAAGIFILSCIILFLCTSAIDRGLSWVIFPVTLINILWVGSILGTFILNKNRTASILLCGFIIFTITYTFSSLNQTAIKNVEATRAFIVFHKPYIPHYTIILAMFFISLLVLSITIYHRKKKMPGDLAFLLGTGYITIIITGFLTISAIMDYVDLNGLGVNPVFTIVLLIAWLIYTLSIAVILKRQLKELT